MKNISTFALDSDRYARFRPTYPPALFAFLASLAPARRLAWDCATGNGQAAVALAAHFEAVVATDISAEQIGNATVHGNVSYRVGAADSSGLSALSVDLITVAQALHWFRLDEFYAEARRVLRADGVIAVWAYDSLHVTAEIDALLAQAIFEPVYPFWSPANHLIFSRYRAVAFPFAEIEAPPFAIEAQWRLADLLGYLSTWSAVKRYNEERKLDIVAMAHDRIAAVWGDAQTPRGVSMPLHLRVGRKE